MIGLMSGTSLDGLDLVCVDFAEDQKLHYEIVAFTTYDYLDVWRQQLQDAFYLNSDEIASIHQDYGRFLGEQVNRFIAEYHLESIDFIASHGHTLFHKPEEGFTLQIGDGQVLANATGYKVICDFRTQDVELGGQGAPLVPIGDRLLFSEYSHCINLGGFANISFDTAEGDRVAYDICPVNVILNRYANHLGLEYDKDGHLASEGELHAELFEALNGIPFYRQAPPKSLGMEWVSSIMTPILNSFSGDTQSYLRTYTEHIAYQIGSTLPKAGLVLLTGGGTKNTFLLERLQQHTQCQLVIPDAILIDSKEALIFALLGYLKNQERVNCLRSVTGAKTDHSSGRIYLPQPN